MSEPSVCPSCGKPAGGKFCRHCGAGLGSGGEHCTRCGGPLQAGARFCSQCGTRTGGTAGLGTNERVLWFLGGGLVVLLVGGLVLGLSRRASGGPLAASAAAVPTAPFAAGADGEGAPPDISSMTPRERFDRLYNRIMRAAESGDETTVTNFSPMALQAYGMLDAVDADARYHAALIRLHTNDVAGARALADTILKKQPGHLFGYIVIGTIARFQKDDKALARAYSDFLAHYDTEQKAKRPEYEEHSRAVEDFLQAARDRQGGKS